MWAWLSYLLIPPQKVRGVFYADGGLLLRGCGRPDDGCPGPAPPRARAAAATAPRLTPPPSERPLAPPGPVPAEVASLRPLGCWGGGKFSCFAFWLLLKKSFPLRLVLFPFSFLSLFSFSFLLGGWGVGRGVNLLIPKRSLHVLNKGPLVT